MATSHQAKNAHRQQGKSRRARNKAQKHAEETQGTSLERSLHEKYPRASPEAIAFMSKAYANPAFLAAMQDLAGR